MAKRSGGVALSNLYSGPCPRPGEQFLGAFPGGEAIMVLVQPFSGHCTLQVLFQLHLCFVRGDAYRRFWSVKWERLPICEICLGKEKIVEGRKLRIITCNNSTWIQAHYRKECLFLSILMMRPAVNDSDVLMTSNTDLPKVDKTAQDAYNLSEAYRFKEQANARYSERDYAAAIYLYHQCLLRARAIQQLSQFGLQSLARLERDVSVHDHEESGSAEGSSKVADATNVAAESAVQKAENFGERRKRISSTSRGEEMKTEATDIALKCYSNLAACILKGQNRTELDFLRAVEYCDKVLSVQPSNEKALYRKGLALSKVNMYEKAIAVLQKCSCTNRGAQIIIDECQQLLAEERRRRDDQVRRNFSRAFGARVNGHHLNQELNDVGVGVNQVVTMNGNAAANLSNEQHLNQQHGN
uniref:Uncharacterized protein n=1 Tax=Setaria digitata TaxID=48799 RepID=A0A915PDJ9_9BILA